jgi:hypothetical protein
MSKIKYIHDISTLKRAFRYDPVTGILYRRLKRSEKPCGCRFSTGHLQVSVAGRMAGVHRIAWALTHGEYPAVEIDHINGDGADNRLENLRLATSAENNRNRRLSSRNRTGVKGVFRVKRGKPWRVAIGYGQGKYYITQFDDFDEATAHAAAMRSRLHAEFANDGRQSMGTP